MGWLKVVVLGTFAIAAVMIVTAAIHLVAPYVSALLVLGVLAYLVRLNHVETNVLEIPESKTEELPS